MSRVSLSYILRKFEDLSIYVLEVRAETKEYNDFNGIWIFCLFSIKIIIIIHGFIQNLITCTKCGSYII